MRILIVLTSHDRLGASGAQTGVGLQTFADAYYRFVEAGIDVAAASPLGGAPPVDPTSLRDEISTEGTRRFATDPAARSIFSNTKPLKAIRADDQDALFFAGGHGGMWDFTDSKAVGTLISATILAGKPVATVCHGAAAFCSAYNEAGRPVVEGHTVTGLSNSEERAIGREKVVPFLLQDRLLSLGAKYEAGPDFTSNVIIDRLLITGQNMMSAEEVAAALLRRCP